MRTDAAQALATLADTETILLKGVQLPATEPATPAGIADAAELAAPVVVEPVYPEKVRKNIQGNIIPGFNKNHQQFLFLRFGEIAATRDWLRWVAPRLATMDEVLNFRREFRAQRLLLGVREPGLTATWIAISLSYRGIAALVGDQQAELFGDMSFRQGLAARSTYLGDPSDPAHPGHRDNWLVGGPNNEADALVIIAADAPADLDAAVDETLGRATEHGLTVLLRQRGDNLAGNLAGHEHFGFKDGISQPGVRGATPGSAEQLITRRYLADTDPHAKLFAKPGQPLLWPGQFLLGERRQHPADPIGFAPPAGNFPAWARRGSYLVCRRLRQDVVAFWDFAATLAAETGRTPVQAAALLVGRWPSGAPLQRAPTGDDPALAGDEFANNHFLFDDDTRSSALEPISGYDGDTYAAARADMLGRVCPHMAHIRKVNPRDSATDFGAPADTLLRLMLRRGIPFGEPLAGVADPSPEVIAAERGLMFVAYASTIEDQFEFVSRRWANSAVQPNLGGHDPVIGQRDRNGNRGRSIELPKADGGMATVAVESEWVTPTGGGYFFAPPISAVAGVLAGNTA